MKSVYIHIPFCKNICSYCDFCKMFYNSKWVDKYLDALNNEIESNYKGELIDTIYIGGGTPSTLNLKQLKKLFKILHQINLNKDNEITFEFNPEDLILGKLLILRQNKVNRLSIGVQTFSKKYLKLLNRSHISMRVIKGLKLAKKLGFDNITVDLMYGFKNQTMYQLKRDLNKIIKLETTHISTYSLILEPHTKLYIDKTSYLDQDLEYEMYSYIQKTLKENNYKQYEISNFSKKGFKSQHNLNYWNNNEYYGFGLGAHGYIHGNRYENTRSFNNYINNNNLLNKHKVLKKEDIENELILGLRKIEGINKIEFKNKFNKNINQVFHLEEMLKQKKLKETKERIYINKKDLYIMNEILLKIM